MKKTMTEKEAKRLIKRLEAAGYVKDDDFSIWEKELDGYKITFHVFRLFSWYATMRVCKKNHAEVTLWLETLKSCRIRDIERMARKMLDYIGCYQKNA